MALPDTTSVMMPRPTDGTPRRTVLDWLLLCAESKAFILKVTLTCGAIAAVTAFLLPTWYTGVSSVMLPQQNQSIAAAMLGNLAPLASIASKDIGLKNPAMIYVATLQSRTVADALVNRFDLKNVYGVKYNVDARERLKAHTVIDPGKDGVIIVTVEARDPRLARDLANAYTEELLRLNGRLAMNEAGQRRRFYEIEMQQAKENLANAEVELRKTQETTGLIKLDAQATALIDSIAALRAQIVAKEVQMRSIRTYATEQNPELLRLGQELAALRAQLAKLEQGAGSKDADLLVPTAKIPRVGLEYVRRLRDVKYQEVMFEVLAKQYEIAKIDELKNTAALLVLDEAVLPEKKSWPPRTLLVMSAALLGFIGAVLVVFLRNVSEFADRDPLEGAKLEAFRSHLSFRRFHR
jgi:uncharacterized protein involved in exopolysaccharide biosynthesis